MKNYKSAILLFFLFELIACNFTNTHQKEPKKTIEIKKEKIDFPFSNLKIHGIRIKKNHTIYDVNSEDFTKKVEQKMRSINSKQLINGKRFMVKSPSLIVYLNTSIGEIDLQFKETYDNKDTIVNIFKYKKSYNFYSFYGLLNHIGKLYNLFDNELIEGGENIRKLE
ncbi:hypothetical protein ACG2LH_16575 [Zhouia sp. PK063]|uniref:hypothetical protein n=1 Tax=Zhouia sp. PK063 TaxID=3373602 RepID=UPI0037BDB1AC